MERKCEWRKDSCSGFWNVECQREYDYFGQHLGSRARKWWTKGDQPEEWQFCPYCGGHIVKTIQGEQ